MKYSCSHCGKNFEAEEKDVVECPGCFWSSSVKRDDSPDASVREKIFHQPDQKGKTGALPLGKLFKAAAGLIAAAVLATAAVAYGPKLFQWVQSSVHEKKAAATKDPVIHFDSVADQPEGTAPDAGMSAWDRLTSEEWAVLERRIQTDSEREPTASEREILEYASPFKTGFVGRLPSEIWTEKDFVELIDNQEIFYKISLSKSYKKKLIQNFGETYLVAGTAFENNELMTSRDGFLASLIFPIYFNDMAKHRGVVLTMLRPFISDTLAKIGSLNHTLLEKQIREQEHAVHAKYTQLIETAKLQRWSESMALIDQTRSLMATLEGPSASAYQIPSYPPVLNQVDDGIRVTLIDMLQTAVPAVADFEPIKRDLDRKEKVISSFVPEAVARQQRFHDEALDAIRTRDVRTAMEKLRMITFPEDLLADAKEKIQILKKMEQANT